MITLSNLLFLVNQSPNFLADRRVAAQTLQAIANSPEAPRATAGGYSKQESEYLLRLFGKKFPLDYLISDGLGGGTRGDLWTDLQNWWAANEPEA